MSHHTIRSEEELLALFGEVGEASVRKEVAFIHPVYRAWIEASPVYDRELPQRQRSTLH
jgi:predicted pyridoxine 5'-phosphate oxidase superfamily flavin-nucleotide-binding protein